MSDFTEEQNARLADIEESIGKLRSEMDFWRQTGIPEKTLLILLNHYTKVPQRTIRLVLEGMESLHEEYFEQEEA
jgi:hypothetical protein